MFGNILDFVVSIYTVIRCRLHRIFCGLGLLFIGGAIMYSIGTLGFADMDVQANYMLAPQYIGIATMLVGAALGFFGLKKD